MKLRRRLQWTFCAWLPLAAAAPLHAQSAENVAVVINESSDASVRIGEHYIRKRSIPSVNVIRIKAPAQEEVSREVLRRRSSDRSQSR